MERAVRKAWTDGCTESGSVLWPKYDLMKNPIMIYSMKEASTFYRK
jgi:hypothetical protein